MYRVESQGRSCFWREQSRWSSGLWTMWRLFPTLTLCSIPSGPFYHFSALVPHPSHLTSAPGGPSGDSFCSASWTTCPFCVQRHRKTEGSRVCAFSRWEAIATVTGARKTRPHDMVGWLEGYLPFEFSYKTRLKLPVETSAAETPFSFSLFILPRSLTCLPWDTFLSDSLTHTSPYWHLLLQNLTWVSWSCPALVKKAGSGLKKEKNGHADVSTLGELLKMYNYNF